jgi:hypothetical protein
MPSRGPERHRYIDVDRGRDHHPEALDAHRGDEPRERHGTAWCDRESTLRESTFVSWQRGFVHGVDRQVVNPIESARRGIRVAAINDPMRAPAARPSGLRGAADRPSAPEKNPSAGIPA